MLYHGLNVLQRILNMIVNAIKNDLFVARYKSIALVCGEFIYTTEENLLLLNLNDCSNIKKYMVYMNNS